MPASPIRLFFNMQRVVHVGGENEPQGNRLRADHVPFIEATARTGAADTGEAQMIFDILAGAVVVGVGGWAWNKLIRHWARTGKRF